MNAVGGEGRAHSGGVGVVDADHSVTRIALALKDALLGGNVAVHAAVAGEMIAGDVKQHRRLTGKMRHQFQLVGRQFQDVGAAKAQGLQIQCRNAHIATDGRLTPGVLKKMRDQRGL